MLEKDKSTDLLKMRSKSKEDRANRIKSDSKDRLKDIVEKKFKTCFIFSLAEFENAFGEKLWGHDLPENELTKDQLKNKEKWLKLRKEILNKGNTQRRAVISEIDLHDIEFRGYRMNLAGDKDNE